MTMLAKGDVGQLPEHVIPQIRQEFLEATKDHVRDYEGVPDPVTQCDSSFRRPLLEVLAETNDGKTSLLEILVEKGFVNVMPLPTHSYKELRQEAGMKLHAHMCKFETDAVRLVDLPFRDAAMFNFSQADWEKTLPFIGNVRLNHQSKEILYYQ